MVNVGTGAPARLLSETQYVNGFVHYLLGGEAPAPLTLREHGLGRKRLSGYLYERGYRAAQELDSAFDAQSSGNLRLKGLFDGTITRKFEKLRQKLTETTRQFVKQNVQLEELKREIAAVRAAVDEQRRFNGQVKTVWQGAPVADSTALRF